MAAATIEFSQVDDLGARALLDFAVTQRRLAQRAEANLLLAAAQWADLHPVVEDGLAAGDFLGQGRLCPLAGEGTPEVAEFAIPEFAAALGLTEQAGVRLIGDALELRHRLPLLWARIQDGDLPAWRGRKVAEHTQTLSIEGAAWVDRQIAPFAHRLSSGRVRELVDAALHRFGLDHPEEFPSAAADLRDVDFAPVPGGQVYVRALLDAVDGASLRDRVEEVAETLARCGDDASESVRRSRALGLLAHPQLTLDLLAGDTHSPASTRGAELRLYVHMSAEDLETGRGVARVEGRGPVSLERVREWISKSDVVIRPVIDLSDEIVVDAYEIPERLREQVLLRDPVCVFPWCGARSHRRDVDHITPYDDTGPPGQTASSNLAPLCRFHHRVKTHSAWRYRRDPEGGYLWTSPLGRCYRVSHLGTRAS
jgi:hypothetical protein